MSFLPPLEMRPSSIAPNPVESRETPPQLHSIPDFSEAPLDLPEITGTSRGNQGFPAPTRKRPQLEKHHVVPTSSQDEALARDGVSREVPCWALKGETVPDSLHATPKSSPTGRIPWRGTPRVAAPLPLSPFSPPDRDRSVDCPAWSGRGSRASRRTSGGGRSHEEIRDEPRGWCHMPNAPDCPVRS